MGAELDPSHLMWQGMDVVACIRYLGPLMFHAAARTPWSLPVSTFEASWTRRSSGYRRIAGQSPDRHRILVQCLGNQSGMAVPRGRRRPRCPLLDPISALAEVDPDIAVNIEHEDAEYSATKACAGRGEPSSCGQGCWRVSSRYMSALALQIVTR